MKKQDYLNQRSDGKEYGLTKRELEILELLSQGSRYKTIASTLYLSNGTVRITPPISMRS